MIYTKILVKLDWHFQQNNGVYWAIFITANIYLFANCFHFTPGFIDNCQFYPLKLHGNFVHAILFIKLDSCRNVKSLLVILQAWCQNTYLSDFGGCSG